jgi:phosphohistidine swiveling domain-containing protein
MVPATVAGTVFSVDLETGAPLISISATWGLGHALVAGLVTPDLYLVDPQTLVLVKRRLGSKAVKEAYDPQRRGHVRVPTVAWEAQRYVLVTEQVRELARQAVAIAAHYRDRHGVQGIDLEFAIASPAIYMLQARPETAYARPRPEIQAVEQGAARQAAALLVGGITGSPGVATGRVCIAASVEKAEKKLAAGDILVVPETTHAWERLLHRAAGVITDIGGPGSHSAVVMREMHKPALVGIGSATSALADGLLVTLDATQRTVYRGAVPAVGLVALSPWAGQEVAPRDLTEDEVWQEACLMTRTYVDAAGQRWIGKPAYQVLPFMQAIYMVAHRQAGQRLDIPTEVQVHDRVHLVRFSDIYRWRGQACALPLEELAALNQERQRAMATYLDACHRLRPAPAAVRAWIAGCVLMNGVMGLSYTIHEAAERLLAAEARDAQVPALILLQARQALAAQMGPSVTAQALREFDHLLRRAQQDDGLAAALAAAAGSLEPLAAVDASFGRQLRRYAARYKVARADEPDLPLESAVAALVAQLAGDLAAGRQPAGRPRVEAACEEFFPESPRLERALRLALEAERARQDAHHLRARGHRLAQRRLAPLVGYLEHRDLIDGYAGIFAHHPRWLVYQAEADASRSSRG